MQMTSYICVARFAPQTVIQTDPDEVNCR